MKRLDAIEGVEGLALLNNPVCTVGVFDGVHRGHRQLLYELAVWAKAADGESCVVTFERHPLEILRGIDVPAILTPKNRLLELERHGVDAVVLIAFQSIRDLSAGEFLIKLKKAGCTRVLQGFDSRMGHDRAEPAELPAIAEGLGIELRIASRVAGKDGVKIGSRFIRDAIRRGDLEAAANALGRPYCLRGEVVHGAGRGRDLGTATANLDVSGQVLPPDGVYLVRVFHGALTAPGVANLGVRPTFGEGGARGLEVHVPQWSGDMYGDVLEVRLGRRLRDEKKFRGAEELKKQIARDLADLAQAVAAGEI